MTSELQIPESNIGKGTSKRENERKNAAAKAAGG